MQRPNRSGRGRNHKRRRQQDAGVSSQSAVSRRGSEPRHPLPCFCHEGRINAETSASEAAASPFWRSPGGSNGCSAASQLINRLFGCLLLKTQLCLRESTSYVTSPPIGEGTAGSLSVRTENQCQCKVSTLFAAACQSVGVIAGGSQNRGCLGGGSQKLSARQQSITRKSEELEPFVTSQSADSHFRIDYLVVKADRRSQGWTFGAEQVKLGWRCAVVRRVRLSRHAF